MTLRDLIFSLTDNRGIAFDRAAGAGEYMRRWEQSSCGWFFSTPSRYQWTGTALIEFAGWDAEQAAIALGTAQASMNAAIVAEEDRRSWLPIEHPSLSGVYHKVTEAISNTKERYKAVCAAGDALPINGGCWDDVDGNPVPMTYGGLCDLWNAIYDRAAVNYGVRKYHITEMLKLADPTTYDYSGGWA
jgi:hypothetical protein